MEPEFTNPFNTVAEIRVQGGPRCASSRSQIVLLVCLSYLIAVLFCPPSVKAGDDDDDDESVVVGASEKFERIDIVLTKCPPQTLLGRITVVVVCGSLSLSLDRTYEALR